MRAKNTRRRGGRDEVFLVCVIAGEGRLAPTREPGYGAALPDFATGAAPFGCGAIA